MGISLKFNQIYKSIKNLNEIELPDLTIITGKNGCGKSQLLEAIAKGDVTVVGYEAEEVENYDFNQFDIKGRNSLSDTRRKDIILEIAKLKEEADFEQIKKLFDKPKSNIFRHYFKDTTILGKTDFFNFFIDKYNERNIFDLNINDILSEYIEQDNLENNDLKNLFITFVKEEVKKILPEDCGGEGCSYENFDQKYCEEAPWVKLNTYLKDLGVKHIFKAPSKNPDENLNYQVKLFLGEESMFYSDLSSGEKILCQLALFKYKKKIKNKKIILMDEMDASLHPSIIKKMLDIINEEFIKNGTKVILVTHSPTTVALADEESLFSLENCELKKISKENAINILSEGFFLCQKID